MLNHRRHFKRCWSRELLIGKKLFGACLVLLLLALTGCIGLVFPPSPAEWKLNSKTKILDEQSMAALAEVDQDGTLIFSSSTPIIESLVQDDIIVLGVAERTPFGLLRRVVDLQREAGRIIVTTNNVALVDAIYEGRVQVSGNLTAGDVVSTFTAEGVAVLPFERQIRYILDTELTDGVWVRGVLEAQIAFDFTLDIRARRVDYVNFEVTMTERSDLRVEGSKPFSLRLEKQIARHRFKPIIVKFVVIVPILTVYVGVDGSVQTSFSASVTHRVTLTAGARYQERWTNLGRFDPQFDFAEPAISAGQIDVRDYAKGELALMIYGVVGPYAVVTPYLELEADPAAQPWWKLHGGLSSHAGVKFQILGYQDDYETGELAGIRKLIASAQEGGGYLPHKRILIYICSNRNDSAGWYTGPNNLRPIVEVLNNLGYAVQIHDQITLPDLTISYMSQFSQVWVLESDSDSLVETTLQEAEELHQFYQRGGGVWISLENELDYGYGDWTEDATPILERFQIKYGGSIGSTRETQPVISSHPLLAGIRWIRFDKEVGYLDVLNPRAEIVWWYESTNPPGSFPGIVVLDERVDKKGRAVFDSGWVLGYAYWQRDDNLVFVRNAALWLEP